MSEQAGTSLGAIRAQQSVLASQHSTAAEAVDGRVNYASRVAENSLTQTFERIRNNGSC